MMQDGKALPGRYLALSRHALFRGTKYSLSERRGRIVVLPHDELGVSTRLIGGVVMTHGDDDGLRLPPAIAPRQIVLVPMLRGKPEDSDILTFCEAWRKR